MPRLTKGDGNGVETLLKFCEGNDGGHALRWWMLGGNASHKEGSHNHVTSFVRNGLA